MTADARLEYRLGDVDAQQVMLAWLDPIEFLREDSECLLDRRLHHDVQVDARLWDFFDHLISSTHLQLLRGSAREAWVPQALSDVRQLSDVIRLVEGEEREF